MEAYPLPDGASITAYFIKTIYYQKQPPNKKWH